MGIAQGYGRTAGSDALVFAYDTGDTRNSYIGEPTTNLINPASLNIYSWWTRSVQTLETLTETYYGHPIYRLSLSLDTDEQRDYARSSGGAGTAWYAPYITYNANTAYIASAIYRPVSHSDMTVKGHPSNIGGWGLNFNDSINLSNGWKRHRIDRNYGATASDHKYYHLWAPSANTGDVLVIDITCNQIEQKNHLTPFVNGTRSATQGLMDLARNNPIDLSAVSFNSDAQIVFDGTDDVITVPMDNLRPTLAITQEVVIYLDANDTQVFIGAQFGTSSNNSYAIWFNGANYLAGGVNIGGSFNYQSAYYAFSTNTAYHFVHTYDGTTQKLYINGDTVLSWDTSGTIEYDSGNTLLAIGNDWNGDGYNRGNYLATHGKQLVTKIYNRALTSDEIRNNYRHYKSRFNI